MTASLELERVTFHYAAGAVLSGLCLSIERGERLALLGPSGCGKSTVIRLLLGFVAPAQGVVRLNGEVVSEAGRVLRPPEERGLAVVFQDLALWPHLTVRGNLAFGLGARGAPRSEQEERIAATLARVGLSDRERRYPGDLSGGERQRVAIARALVLEPHAVLLDEPMANLDVVLKRELLLMFRELLEEKKITTLYVTHDPREGEVLGGRVAVIEHGSVVQTGTAAELQASPASPFVEELFVDLRRGAADARDG